MSIHAVVDCGSHSFQLVVVRGHRDGAWEVLARDKEVLRLAERLEAGSLPPSAIDRCVEVLARFKRQAEAHGAGRILAVATSAVREAINARVFLERAEREAGIRVRVIDGLEEARLIHQGVASGFPFGEGRIAIADIGGGSTELIVGTASAVLTACSLALGAVGLTRQWGADHEAMRQHVLEAIGPVAAELRKAGFDTLVGTSGTIASLAAVDAAQRGLEVRSGYTLSTERVGALARSLGRMSLAERQALPGLSPERADTAVAGACLLHTLMAQLEVDGLTICRRALRDGLIVELLHAAAPAKPSRG